MVRCKLPLVKAMAKLMICLFVSLLFTLPVLADKPTIEYGEIAELKGVKKIFIDTGTDMVLRDEIGAEIRKELRDLKIAGRPEDSEIHLRYAYQVSTSHGGGRMPQVLKTPEGTVVKILGHERLQVILTMKWPQSGGPRIGIGVGKKPRPDLDFARAFVKAYKEANAKPAPREATPEARGAQSPVRLEKTWNGEVNIELRQEAPEDGYIANKAKWEALWKAYRGGEELPKVDFAKELVLVAVNRDPNRISIQAKLDDKGDLTVMHISTKMGFVNPKACKYEFAVVSRDGIKSINGKTLKNE